MHPQIEGATDEARFLRRCMNDLISLCALPAVWSGAGPEQIARTLVDALVEMLQLDFVHLRLNHTGDHEAVELVRTAPKLALTNQSSQDTGAALRRVLGDDPGTWPSRIRGRLAGTDLSIVTMRLDVQCHIGVLIAASERPDFAEDTEMLLLNVAANQAVIALQGARLLGEQTRLARTLNHRVAQRTSELAQVNDALKAEIAERRRTEEALRASEKHSRSVIDGIPGLVAILAPDGAVQAVNRQIVEYTGRELEELRQWGPRGTVHVADLPHVAEVFTRSMAAGTAYDIEQRLRRFDGAYRWFQNRGIPVHDASGRITHWYVLLTDIEDRKRTEDTLEKVRSELARVTRTMSLGVLTASIAHEVNQPLSGIITNANTCLRMLAANPPNLDGALETARRTIRDGNRASDVIARLRALFRRGEVVTEAIDLNEATREVIALSSQDLQRRGISLQTELYDNLPAVSGDRVQLQQVILNLLLNASDALKAVDDRPKHIFIQTTYHHDGAARLTVRDSGVGVVTESVNKLFDAFYTTKPDGMGIGLSVSRSIIESHHGRLWCEPNSGPGAMFAFSLPVIRREAQARDSANRQPVGGG